MSWTTTASRAIDTVSLIEAMGWTPPKAIEDARQSVLDAQQRVSEYGQEAPAPFSADDLAADDWRERLDTAALAAVSRVRGVNALQEALQEVNARNGAAHVEALQEAGDWLESWFIDHLDDLVAHEHGQRDSGETLARLEQRERDAEAFYRAHGRLMVAGGLDQMNPNHYAAAHWTLFTWTAEQWEALIGRTGPNMSAKHPLRLAVEIGATPRLARAGWQPLADFNAMWEPVQEHRQLEAMARTSYTIAPGNYTFH